MWYNRASVNFCLSLILLIFTYITVINNLEPILISIIFFLGMLFFGRTIEIIFNDGQIDYEFLKGIYFFIGLLILIPGLYLLFVVNDIPARAPFVGLIIFVGVYLMRFYRSFGKFLSRWFFKFLLKGIEKTRRAHHSLPQDAIAEFFSAIASISIKIKNSVSLWLS